MHHYIRLKVTVILMILSVCMGIEAMAQGQVRRPSNNDKPHAGQTQPKKKTQNNISGQDGQINGYGYVDLGLPSGTKWATCNVGASSPTDWGEFFSWGEIIPKTMSTKDHYSLTKDFHKEWLINAGIIDNNDNLTSDFDMATQICGSGWSLPTKEQIEELTKYTTKTWTKINGVWGKLVRSNRNGKTLFFPAAEMGSENKTDFTGNYYIYWGRTLASAPQSGDSYNYARVYCLWTSQLNFYLHFTCEATWVNPARAVVNKNAIKQERKEPLGQEDGQPIEQNMTIQKKGSYPLSEPDGYANELGYVDLGLPSGTKWGACNIGASSPEEVGAYYAWGETREKLEYESRNSLTSGKKKDWCIENHFTDSNGLLLPNHDAASVNCGEGWEMPSETQIRELISYTSKVNGNYNGVKGFYLVSNVNGKCIFLPSSGVKNGTSIKTDGSAKLLGKSINSEMENSSCGFSIYGDGVWSAIMGRESGYNIRPVYTK